MRIYTSDDKSLPLATLRRWIESWLPARPLDVRVNNAEAATTPGTVTDKVPVYNQEGDLLGYFPVYDDIT